MLGPGQGMLGPGHGLLLSWTWPVVELGVAGLQALIWLGVEHEGEERGHRLWGLGGEVVASRSVERRQIWLVGLVVGWCEEEKVRRGLRGWREGDGATAVDMRERRLRERERWILIFLNFDKRDGG